LRDHFNDTHSPVSLADVMLKVLLMVFIAMTVLALVAKKNNEESNIKKKAEYQITAEWNKEQNPDIDCDVDLWVRNPNGQLVFWRARENNLMNIERDDVGMRNDFIRLPDGRSVKNEEDMEYWYLRGIIPGEYTVNLHLYACAVELQQVDPTYTLDIPVEVKLTRLNPRMQIIEVRQVKLTKVYQELTVMNFTLAGDGAVSKITDIPVDLIRGDGQ
jgi:hypothetical protein